MIDENPTETINILEKQNIKLQDELRNINKKPQGQIAYILFTLGLIFLALALVHTNTISAFIGIALTFWGALLLYIRPTKFIRQEILATSIVEPLMLINRILSELDYQGTPTFISPGTLGSLQNVFLYIPKSGSLQIPKDEDIPGEKIFYDDPPSIKITPSGFQLSKLLEADLRTNFNSVDMEYLNNNLGKAIVDGFELTKSFEMEYDTSSVQVTMKETIFDELIDLLNKEKNPVLVGDPITSAIACILALMTRNPVKIASLEYDKTSKTLNVAYEIAEHAKQHTIVKI